MRSGFRDRRPRPLDRPTFAEAVTFERFLALLGARRSLETLTVLGPVALAVLGAAR